MSGDRWTSCLITLICRLMQPIITSTYHRSLIHRTSSSVNVYWWSLVWDEITDLSEPEMIDWLLVSCLVPQENFIEIWELRISTDMRCHDFIRALFFTNQWQWILSVLKLLTFHIHIDDRLTCDFFLVSWLTVRAFNQTFCQENNIEIGELWFKI
jgi:hypothetical protein